MMLGVDSDFYVRLCATLLHSVWQAGAIAAAAFMTSRLMPRSPARVRYGVFVLALAAVALCPAITFTCLAGKLSNAPTMIHAERPARTISPIPISTSIQPDIQNAPALIPTGIKSAPAPARSEFGLRSFAPYFVLIYAFGVLLMIAHLLFALRGGVRLRQKSRMINDPELIDSLARAARAIGFKVMPALAWCERVGAPTVVGIIRPAILIPLSLANGLSAGQVELLLMHELAHLRRHDHWVNLAQRVIEALYFFNPAVWLISRRIRLDRELACDDMVLGAGVKQAAYADSLLRMAELSRERTASAFALSAGGSPLGRRILRIIGRPAHEQVKMNRVWPVVCISLLLAAAIFSYVGRVSATDAKPAENPIAKKETTAREAVRDAATTATLVWGKAVDGLRAAEDSAWGVPDGGVQVRLRAEKREFQRGETLKLWADVRNEGDHLYFFTAHGVKFELEYDGQWYSVRGGAYSAPAYDAFSKKDHVHPDIPITLHSGYQRKEGVPDSLMMIGSYQRKTDGVPLQITPGKHTIRVAAPMAPSKRDPIAVKIRPISNPVEIEIQ